MDNILLTLILHNLNFRYVWCVVYVRSKSDNNAIHFEATNLLLFPFCRPNLPNIL